jgi:peptide/nickel transport system permease protein
MSLQATSSAIDGAAHPATWRRAIRHPQAVIGSLLVLFVVVMAVFAPWLAPYNPLASDWGAIRQAPSFVHLLGTDDLGRDVLSRVIFGARTSLQAGVLSVLLAMAIGIPIGIVSGYFGGWIDRIFERITEGLLAVPFLILAIAFGAFLGPSLQNAMIAIGISATPIFIRLARGQAMVATSEDYVEAARAVGASHLRILLTHILPNCAPPLIVHGTLTMGIAVLAEASLAFLGLGQLPPDASWGTMLDAARQFLSEAPWMAVWPGLAIIVAVVGFNLLGDGLRDLLDPRDQ